jgi:hypothetical protein
MFMFGRHVCKCLCGCFFEREARTGGLRGVKRFHQAIMSKQHPPLVTLPLGQEHSETKLLLPRLGGSPKASCV